jgi:hypothetical protein
VKKFAQRGATRFILQTKYYSGNQIKNNEIGHVAQIGARGDANRVLVGNLRGRDHLKDLDLDERIILKWI